MFPPPTSFRRRAIFVYFSETCPQEPGLELFKILLSLNCGGCTVLPEPISCWLPPASKPWLPWLVHPQWSHGSTEGLAAAALTALVGLRLYFALAVQYSIVQYCAVLCTPPPPGNRHPPLFMRLSYRAGVYLFPNPRQRFALRIWPGTIQVSRSR